MDPSLPLAIAALEEQNAMFNSLYSRFHTLLEVRACSPD